MHRPRHSGWLLLIPVLVALALTAAGCGGSAHDLMVRKFFISAAAGDVATLGNIATVSFDPNKDGKAQNLKFVSETPEQTRVLKIAELEKVYKEAQAAGDRLQQKDEGVPGQEHRRDQPDREDRAGRQGQAGWRDLQIQAAWTKFRDDNAVVQKAKADALKALQTERKVPDLSLPDVDAGTAAESRK